MYLLQMNFFMKLNYRFTHLVLTINEILTSIETPFARRHFPYLIELSTSKGKLANRF